MLLALFLCSLLVSLACTSRSDESVLAGDQQSLSKLIPADHFPAGFYLLSIGPLEPETGKGLVAGYQNDEGSRIAVSILNTRNADEARREFDRELDMSKSLPYGFANTPDASGGFVARCDSRIAIPAANACALMPAVGLKVGTHGEALETTAPVQGKHWTIDIFQRGDLVLAVKVDQAEDSRVQVDRAGIVTELDRRAKHATED